MINSNTNQCCDNYSHKTIFSSNEYEWRICYKCDLIYQSSNNDKFKQVKDIQFDNYIGDQERGKNEFLSTLNKLKKYTTLSNLTFFDFGCADGTYLKIAQKYFKKVQGMEPNLLLKERAIKKKLDVLDSNFLNEKDVHYDVIFTRNTFEYVSNFSVSFYKLMKKLNKGGYFIWRDKYYDYFPKDYSNRERSSHFNSFPTKNSILYHLSKNQIKILEARFYFNKSFLVIGQKNENLKEIYKKRINFNSFFYNNYFVCNIVFFISKKIDSIYLFLRKFKFFILSKLKK